MPKAKETATPAAKPKKESALAARMTKVAAGSAAATSMPTRPAAPVSKPRRVTLDLSGADHRAMKQAAFAAETSMAELLRALVSLYQEDPSLKEAANQRAATVVE